MQITGAILLMLAAGMIAVSIHSDPHSRAWRTPVLYWLWVAMIWPVLLLGAWCSIRGVK